MAYEMRRTDRSISEAQAREIMAQADHGFLATVGEDGWPYVVPLNHVLDGDTLYVHCALGGHKLDNIAHDERVSYCGVAHTEIDPKAVTTRYRSAIAFGRASVVEDEAEKRKALELLGRRFCAGYEAEVQAEIRQDGPKTSVVRIRIERITGKANIPA